MSTIPGSRLLPSLTAVALLLPSSASAQDQTLRLSGQNVAVYNLAGTVEVTAGSGSDVAVTVRRRGADAERLDVRTGRVDTRRESWGEVDALRVIYPTDRVFYEGPQGYGGRHGHTELRVRADGTFWGRNDRRGGRRVEIGDRVDGLDASADLAISVPPGKRILVALAVGTIGARNVDGDLYLDTGSGSITTSGTTGRLDLDTGSGSVTVDDADGPVRIDTGSGDVEARRIRGPELSIDTGSGNVTVEGVDAPKIEVDTGSGEVSVLGARTGRIGVDTGSGDVTIETVAGSASMEVDTGSGNVTISIPADYAGSVHFDTSSGRLHTDLPITITRKDDDEIEGRIGNGGSARIEVDTGSGGISLRRS
jgi:hypothetical protein